MKIFNATKKGQSCYSGSYDAELTEYNHYSNIYNHKIKSYRHIKKSVNFSWCFIPETDEQTFLLRIGKKMNCPFLSLSMKSFFSFNCFNQHFFSSCSLSGPGLAWPWPGPPTVGGCSPLFTFLHTQVKYSMRIRVAACGVQFVPSKQFSHFLFCPQ